MRIRDSSNTLLHLGYFKNEKEARLTYIRAKVEQLDDLLNNYKDELSVKTFDKFVELRNELSEIGYNEQRNFTKEKEIK